MAVRTNYYWRVFATGLSFLLFGIGGLIITVVAIPVIFLAGPDRREALAKATLHIAFRLFVGIMHRLGVLTYEVDRVAELKGPGLLVVANHPTLIDIVFLISLIPRADCIVKNGLDGNPFMRGAIRFAGYIYNDDPVQVIEQAMASLKRGNSLIIFPEGTRSRRSEPMTMRRGASNIAIRSAADLTPVVIGCDPLTLGKDEKWYDVPVRRFHYTVQVKDRIPTAEYRHGPANLESRRLTRYLQDFFKVETN